MESTHSHQLIVLIGMQSAHAFGPEAEPEQPERTHKEAGRTCKQSLGIEPTTAFAPTVATLLDHR